MWEVGVMQNSHHFSIAKLSIDEFRLLMSLPIFLPPSSYQKFSPGVGVQAARVGLQRWIVAFKFADAR